LSYKLHNIVFRHILPASLMNESMNASDSFYEDALSHGEPVVVYMHGNSGSRGSPHRVELYTLLRNMNYHVIAFDYRSKFLVY
jgi:abhydrolase domain-containing protein 12